MNPPRLSQPIRFDRKKLQPPLRDILQYIQLVAKTVPQARKGQRKREATRHTIGMAFPVMPVDEQGNPMADEFLGAVSDLSTSGIAIVHDRLIEAKYLVVELDVKGLEPVQLLVEVVRNRPVERYFEIAGRFVGRVAAVPAATQ